MKESAKQEHHFNVRPYLTKISAVFVILLGMLVLIGWYIKNISLIQVLPNFAPMQYNTALGFLLIGVGLFALDNNKYHITKICASIVASIGILTLFEYITHINIGIDQLFMEHYIMTKTSHPGRMAPNTALCFLLTSMALLFHNRNAVFFSLSCAVLFLSLVALVGYLVGHDEIYGWGTFTRMAVHTATGFIVLSATFIVLCIKLYNENFDLWRVSPAIVFITLLSMTFISFDGSNEVLKEHNKQYFKTLVKDSNGILQKRLELYQQALLGGLGAFNVKNDITRDEWRLYVESLNAEETLPGTNGIGFIDSVKEQDLERYLAKTRADNYPSFTNHPQTDFKDKFIIKYIEPVDINFKAVGLDIGFEKNRRQGAEHARDTGLPVLTKVIFLVQDNEKKAGFLLLVPAYKKNATIDTVEGRRRNLIGWVYSPFMGRSFMKGVEDVTGRQLHFKVYDGYELTGDNLIYKTNDDEHSYENNFNYHTQLTFAERQWTIVWNATKSFSPPANQNLPFILLTLGLIFSFILSGLFYLLSKIYGAASKNLIENASYDEGANSYVQKPVNLDGLFDSISKLRDYWFEVVILPKE